MLPSNKMAFRFERVGSPDLLWPKPGLFCNLSLYARCCPRHDQIQNACSSYKKYVLIYFDASNMTSIPNLEVSVWIDFKILFLIEHLIDCKLHFCI